MIFFKSVMIPCLLLYESYEFGFHTGGRLGLINPERGVTISYFVNYRMRVVIKEKFDPFAHPLNS